MSLFDKKFKQYLERSPEYKALKVKTEALEAQVATMSKAMSDIMRAYSDLARITIDNRKSLEEVFAFLTEPYGELPEATDVSATDPTSDMSDEELAEYKRNLN